MKKWTAFEGVIVMVSVKNEHFCSLSKLQTKPQLCFTLRRPNDVSIFIPNKAQSTFSVGANSTQGEYLTGHFLSHKSSQMNCTSLPSFPFPTVLSSVQEMLGWWEYVAFLTWSWSYWLMTFILRTLFLWPFSMRATYHLHSSETETAVVTEASVHVEDRGYFHCGRKWPSWGWMTNLFQGYLLRPSSSWMEIMYVPQHVWIQLQSPSAIAFKQFVVRYKPANRWSLSLRKFTRHAERFSSNFQPCNTSAQTVRGWRFYKDNSCYCFSITMVIKHSSTRSAKTGSNISRLCLLNNFIVERVQIVAWQ